MEQLGIDFGSEKQEFELNYNQPNYRQFQRSEGGMNSPAPWRVGLYWITREYAVMDADGKIVAVCGREDVARFLVASRNSQKENP